MARNLQAYLPLGDRMYWQKTRDGFLGMAAGSAVGVPVDCRSRSYLEENPVTGMEGYGTYNLPPGFWSDAVSMSCCLAEALCSGNKRSLIIEKLILWRDTGYWTPDGEVVGVWNTAVEAVAVLKKRVEEGESCCLDSGEYVFNASLGWVLPLAYVTCGLSPEQRIKAVTDIASLTNSHMRSNLACIMYNEIAVRLLQGIPFDDSVVEVQEFMLDRFSEEREMTHFARIMSGRIVSLRPHEIHTSNYIIDTLEACVWTLLTTSSYKEAVLTAVNLGHDTDTLGAITGGMAGILYGAEGIPEEWFEKLVLREKLEELCDLFSKRMEELATKRKGRSTTV